MVPYNNSITAVVYKRTYVPHNYRVLDSQIGYYRSTCVYVAIVSVCQCIYLLRQAN